MDFAINAMSHSRVLVPWEIQQYPNITVQDSSAGLNAMLGGTFQADWGNGDSVWNAWRKTCQPRTPARRIYATVHSQKVEPVNYFDPKAVPSGDDFTFVANTSASHTDYCTKPLEYLGQGQFYSDWRTVHALYPIFSPAKARGFSDIRIPSHYYFGNTPRYTYGWDFVNLELKDADAMEVPWEHKQDKVFWRGASTGGGNHPPMSADKFQRQRFVKMASDVEGNRTVTVVGPSGLSTASVPLDKLNREVLDVALVKASLPGAYPGGLDGMLKELRFDDAVELGRHWAYKYLVDMDGVGYSARFMAFLASDSVPVKASVYNEFYEGWIEPWCVFMNIQPRLALTLATRLHYIPLSSSYREIYNIHAYFSGPTESTAERLGTGTKALNADRRLRRLARAGKQWKKTMGRHVDMEGASQLSPCAFARC
jgi:hypothetical protein